MTRMLLSHLFNIVLVNLANKMKQVKEIKGIHIEKGKKNCSYNHIACLSMYKILINLLQH